VSPDDTKLRFTMAIFRSTSRASSRRQLSVLATGAGRCRGKFLRFFPSGFEDDKYVAWERGYKEAAHQTWLESLGPAEFKALLRQRSYTEIAARAVRIESRTNLLFSFEKMALRDAVKSPAGAELFATSLFEFLHGKREMQERFERWTATVAELPRKQTRVLTWPVVTVFGFIAQPEQHIFLKPKVTREAARQYEFDFDYLSRPNWETYASLLQFAATVRRDLSDLRPRDMLDLQSFLWVQGSDEYGE
jgi:hypothetical protein